MSKRVIADIGELQQPLYAESGIYYHADDANVRQGLACVFGPEGTPYEDCPMLYSFNIPEGFPFESPKVLFHTNDGITRFHPNMYREGKVCLSILGTWQGPEWASTMRLSTVLVTLQSLMDTNPIVHEPGYSNPTPEMRDGYVGFVEYACMRYILDRAEGKKPVPEQFVPFQNEFTKRLPGILSRLEKRLISREEKSYRNLPYQLQGTTNYAQLYQRVLELRKEHV